MILGEQSVTIIAPGEQAADYGNGTAPDWDTATEATVEGCSIQPAPAPEFTIGQDSVTTRWEAWLPWGTSIAASYRIRWAGDTYEIDGDIQSWDFPPLQHLTALLRRSEEAP